MNVVVQVVELLDHEGVTVFGRVHAFDIEATSTVDAESQALIEFVKLYPDVRATRVEFSTRKPDVAPAAGEWVYLLATEKVVDVVPEPEPVEALEAVADASAN